MLILSFILALVVGFPYHLMKDWCEVFDEISRVNFEELAVIGRWTFTISSESADHKFRATTSGVVRRVE